MGHDIAVEDPLAQDTQGDAKGKLFVGCYTVHAEPDDKIPKAVEAKGAYSIACPVFWLIGGQLPCESAVPKEQVDKVKPYCEGVVGRAVVDYDGSALSMIEKISEGHVVAEKTGLGVDDLHQVIETIFPGTHTAKFNGTRSGDYYP